jgi:hypothetical protein
MIVQSRAVGPLNETPQGNTSDELSSRSAIRGELNGHC